MDQKQIAERIELLKQQRSKFISDEQAAILEFNRQLDSLTQQRDARATLATQKIGEFNGRIAELESMLTEKSTTNDPRGMSDP